MKTIDVSAYKDSVVVERKELATLAGGIGKYIYRNCECISPGKDCPPGCGGRCVYEDKTAVCLIVSLLKENADE